MAAVVTELASLVKSSVLCCSLCNMCLFLMKGFQCNKFAAIFEAVTAVCPSTGRSGFVQFLFACYQFNVT